jgi:hypothetical protein
MISNIDIKDGKLRSIAVKTETVEFSYQYYEQDNAVALFMSRKLDTEHWRTINAFVNPPDVAKKLIDASLADHAAGEEKETVGGLWKHVLDIADVITNNAGEIASARVGDNITIHNGIMVTLGYELLTDRYRVFADAEWRNGEFTCRAYERDMVQRQDIKNLKYYVKNVLSLVELCIV